jgi:hypothetical protein
MSNEIINTTNNDWLNILSIIAAGVSAVLSVLAYRFSLNQSRIKGKLYVGLEWVMLGDPQKTNYVNFIFYNTGLRDIYFNWPCMACKYLTRKKDSEIILKTGIQGQDCSFVVQAGNSRSLISPTEFPQEELNDISYLYLFDSIGNEFRFYIAPWYIRFFHWRIFKMRKLFKIPKIRFKWR